MPNNTKPSPEKPKLQNSKDFEKFLDKNYHALLRIAFSKVRDAQEASDLLQEAVLQVHREFQRGKFESEPLESSPTPTTYIAQRMTWVLLNGLRKRKREPDSEPRPETDQGEARDAYLEGHTEAVDQYSLNSAFCGRTPLEDLLLKEKAERIIAIVEDLPETLQRGFEYTHASEEERALLLSAGHQKGTLQRYASDSKLEVKLRLEELDEEDEREHTEPRDER